jgi:hypothetical protein
MSQATRRTTNLNLQSDFAAIRSGRRTSTLVLPTGLAAALEELCMLAAYHPDGFTYTPQMEAACQHIADKSSPAAIDACLARASIRERAYVTASRAA